MQLEAGEPGLTLRARRADGVAVVEVAGALALNDADRLGREVRDAATAGVEVRVDLSALETLDGGGAATLVGLCDALCRAGTRCELVGAQDEVAAQLALYATGARGCEVAPGPGRVGTLDHVGRATVETYRAAVQVLDFVGELTVSLGRILRRPREVPWRDVPPLAERAGADGLPIALLINFLVGFIIALQSAAQMRRFGAEIFVADLTVLSVTRELAPLMTAILVAGRSGAAFAAELGTMRVNEEVDALRALRIDPLAYLVVPRVLALLLVVPLVTLMADLVGIAGGMAVAVFSMDLGWETFLRRAGNAAGLNDVVVGVLKSIGFAATIALVACQRGLAAEGGATGVGRSTTSAVVSVLFFLIVLDALFTALFSVLGL